MWKTVNIGSVCLETNQRDPTREPDKEFVYVDIASLDNQTKRINGTQRILGKKAPSRARKEIQSGDVLVSTVRPNLNAVASVTPTLDGQIASTGFCVLRPNPALIDSRFLLFRTTSKEFVEYLSSRVTGANYPAVSDSVVKSAPIPLPPLPIQKQIAAILEKADAAREKRRQANQLTEQFLQSAFFEMFGDPVTNPKGWESVTIGSEIADISDGNYSSAYPRPTDFVSKGIPFVRANNLQNDRIVWRDMRYITSKKHKELKKGHLKTGDVLITTRGMLGNVAIAGPEFHDANMNAQLVRLHPSETQLLPVFLLHILRQPIVQQQIKSLTTGTTLKQLPVGRLRKLKIAKPPMKEQEKFAALVEQVEGLRGKQSKSEKELENLFQSLMQRAFRGELVA